MSCVQQLGEKGYWINEEQRGFTVEPTRWGDAYYKCKNGKCIFILKYNYTSFKRIRIKYNISVSASGTNITCAAGFGIKRLVIWVLDPMEKLFNYMNTLVQIMIILQLLSSLLSAI